MFQRQLLQTFCISPWIDGERGFSWGTEGASVSEHSRDSAYVYIYIYICIVCIFLSLHHDSMIQLYLDQVRYISTIKHQGSTFWYLLRIVNTIHFPSHVPCLASVVSEKPVACPRSLQRPDRRSVVARCSRRGCDASEIWKLRLAALQESLVSTDWLNNC